MLERLTLQLQLPWQIISSSFPPDLKAIDDPEYVQWRADSQERHDHCVEIIVGLSGRSAFGFNSEVYVIEPGVCMISASRDYHDTGRSLDGAPAEYVCFHFYPGYIYWEIFELNHINFNSLTLFTLKDTSFNWWCCNELENVHNLNLNPTQKRIFLESLLTCIKLSILDQIPRNPANPYPCRRDRIFMVMKKIINSHGANISASDMARLAGYSKYHFLHIFKEHTGCTLGEYINKVRLAHCRKLMDQGVEQKRIATEIGFKSTVAFSHWLARQRQLYPGWVTKQKFIFRKCVNEKPKTAKLQ